MHLYIIISPIKTFCILCNSVFLKSFITTRHVNLSYLQFFWALSPSHLPPFYHYLLLYPSLLLQLPSHIAFYFNGRLYFVHIIHIYATLFPGISYFWTFKSLFKSTVQYFKGSLPTIQSPTYITYTPLLPYDSYFASFFATL